MNDEYLTTDESRRIAEARRLLGNYKLICNGTRQFGCTTALIGTGATIVLPAHRTCADVELKQRRAGKAMSTINVNDDMAVMKAVDAFERQRAERTIKTVVFDNFAVYALACCCESALNVIDRHGNYESLLDELGRKERALNEAKQTIHKQTADIQNLNAMPAGAVSDKKAAELSWLQKLAKKIFKIE